MVIVSVSVRSSVQVVEALVARTVMTSELPSVANTKGSEEILMFPPLPPTAAEMAVLDSSNNW